MSYICCICKNVVDENAEEKSFLDPCALVLISNVDQAQADHKEQEFYCHFACFRKLIGDESLLYIAETDFPTRREIDAEYEKESSDA